MVDDASMAAVTVVGAGISGLSLAYLFADAGHEVTVLERSHHVGGCIDTRRTEAFWLEMGPHTCYRTYAHVLELSLRLGLHAEMIARRPVPFRVWQHGTIASIASRLRFGALLLHLPRGLWLGKRGRTMREYYSAVAGPANYEAVLGPAFNALLGQDVSDVPADILLKRRKRASRRVAAGVARSFTFRGGLAALVRAVSEHPAIAIRTGAHVQDIHAKDGGFRVATDAGDVEAGTLALACDAVSTRRLLAGIAPEGAATLAPLELSGIASDAAIVRRSACPRPEVAGLIGVETPFTSAVSRDVVADPELRSFTFHFRAHTPEATRTAIMAEVLGVPRADWVAREQKAVALPMFRRGHQERIAALDAALAGRPILVTGNYFFGASLEDCAARSFHEFARWQRERPGA